MALLAVVGVVLVHPSRRVAAIGGYDLSDISGRYVSAETAYDISTSHIDINGDYGAPVFFATTAVMYVDGNGNVFGESDGFYGGTPPPGVNLGPSFFHGKYTIEPSSGRLTFKTCSYPGPFGASGTPCDTTGGATHPAYKTMVGYPAVLEDSSPAVARTFTTVEPD